jgi:hypothetical protein
MRRLKLLTVGFLGILLGLWLAIAPYYVVPVDFESLEATMPMKNKTVLQASMAKDKSGKMADMDNKSVEMNDMNKTPKKKPMNMASMKMIANHPCVATAKASLVLGLLIAVASLMLIFNRAVEFVRASSAFLGISGLVSLALPYYIAPVCPGSHGMTCHQTRLWVWIIGGLVLMITGLWGFFSLGSRNQTV